MAYFLKKSNLKKGIYLQIYESFYDPERKDTAHKSFKALGYVDDLIASGIQDPVSYFKNEVSRLNQEAAAQKRQNRKGEISSESPERFAGYFPLKSLNDSLGVEGYLKLLQLNSDFQFSVYSVLSSLLYARAVAPCSKSRTFHDVLPRLFESRDFSLDQLYSCVEYVGHEYEKIIEIYNHQLGRIFPFDTSYTYFDCTNFYFEIDKEDFLRRKGLSKENKKEPIVGLGLLLDASQIPVGMKLYPGNQSEKPVMREIIDDLKKRHHISGRTIRVADKGLNCGENIMHALKAGDGYLFSRSVKQISAVEQTWVLLEDGYRDVVDKSGKVLYRIKSCVDAFEYTVEENGKERKFKVNEKRVATFNPDLAKKQRLEIDREIEKARALTASGAKRSEYGDSAKYVTFKAVDKKGEDTGAKIKAQLNQKAIDKAKQLAGYSLFVSSELKSTATDLYRAYHNLWRIEESFRVMKSDLDARPAYLQKQDSITGHFLICYLCVLLMRILQIKILHDSVSSESLSRFFKNFRVVKVSDRKYVNISFRTEFIEQMQAFTGLPLLSYYLSQGDVSQLMGYRFPLPKPGNPERDC